MTSVLAAPAPTERKVGLRIGAGMALPEEAVTQTFAILAKRGVGKTYTAAVLVEELVAHQLPVVVVDPIGVWWGIRSSSDGKAPGLPVAIFGGEHGDIPLEVTAGGTIADLVVEENVSCVLDLSGFRKGEQSRFMTDFLERLYHRNRTSRQVVIDEADAFAPQRPMRGEERMLGAVEDLVRRGRARGLGATLITQRSAVLNKNVLTQVEVLVALRTISPQDRAAVDAWIEVHGTPEQRAEMMDSLPSLPVGTAWFWSPGWLDVFQRVQVRRRRTFDSSATPKAGASAQAPKTVADVDLAALRDRMAATIEKAKADDPRELRRRITGLETEVVRLRDQAPPAPERVTVEVPVLPESVAVSLDAKVNEIQSAVAALQAVTTHLAEQGATLSAAVLALRGAPVAAVPGQPDAVPTPSRRRTPAGPSVRESVDGISRPQQRILDALASLAAVGVTAPAKTHVALFAGASPRSSGFSNNLSSLKTQGLIEYPSPGCVGLTEEGAGRAARAVEALTSADLQEAVYALVSGPQARILRVLVNCYPDALTKAALAERAGASSTSSGYSNNLSALRTLGFLDYPAPGQVAATSLMWVNP